MVDYVDGFRGRQETDTGSIAEEAEVPVVSNYQYGTVPCDLRSRGGTRTDIVHRADVAAGEADSRTQVIH